MRVDVCQNTCDAEEEVEEGLRSTPTAKIGGPILSTCCVFVNEVVPQARRSPRLLTGGLQVSQGV
jgi:hypothetical protein